MGPTCRTVFKDWLNEGMICQCFHFGVRPTYIFSAYEAKRTIDTVRNNIYVLIPAKVTSNVDLLMFCARRCIFAHRLK